MKNENRQKNELQKEDVVVDVRTDLLWRRKGKWLYLTTTLRLTRGLGSHLAGVVRDYETRSTHHSDSDDDGDDGFQKNFGQDPQMIET